MAFLALCVPPILNSNRHRIPRRRTAAAAVPGASAQSLLRALLLGRRVVRKPKEEDAGAGAGGGGDPVQFPSRFTRRLKLDDDDEGGEEEGIDDVDEGEHKSRLISQVSKARPKSLSDRKELFDFLSCYGSVL